MKYHFLAWSRRGLAAEISTPDQLGAAPPTVREREQLELALQVNGEAVPKNIRLAGPGDVLGFKRDQVVRTEPRDGITNFEPNYLAFIEFYDEDFAWRYTPAAPVSGPNTGNQKLLLRPWLTLLVLEDKEFTFNPRSKPLPSLHVLSEAALPLHQELHLWAHVHSNLDGGSEAAQFLSKLQTASAQDPDGLYSRVLCPRRLAPNRRYHAFVVPTFEAGRLAGLGLPTDGIDGQAPAWNTPAVVPLEMPCYYHWVFRTGENFDFEYLARLIKPRVLPATVGLRDMDISRPGYTLPAMPSAKPVHLEGALLHLQAQPRAYNPNEPLGTGLKKMLDQAALPVANLTEDPLLAPPFYGFHYPNPNPNNLDLANAGWVHELNRHPAQRAAAGLGAEVVRRNQERWIDDAWQQAQHLRLDNNRLRITRFAAEVGEVLYKKTIGALLATNQQERAFALLRPVAGMVKSEGDTVSIWRTLQSSVVPETLMQSTFRRITSLNGPTYRRIDRVWRGDFSAVSIFKGAWSKTNVMTGSIMPTIYAPYTWEWTPMPPIAQRMKANFTAWLSNLHSEWGPVWFNMQTGDSKRPVIIRNPPVPIEPNVAFQAFQDLYKRIKPTTDAKTKEDLTLLPNLSKLIRDATIFVKPENAHLKRLPAYLEATAAPANLEEVKAVMDYPTFEEPLSKHLAKMDPQYILPNIDQIPPNTAALLKANARFIRAVLVGANHEMGAELLWREYPTDQRGSYFQQFWDIDRALDNAASRDVPPLHTWQHLQGLGAAALFPRETSVAEPLVLVLRTDLLQKFPNAVIYAHRAERDGIGYRLKTNPTPADIKMPLFFSKPRVDIQAVGFDLEKEEALGQETGVWGLRMSTGWFFVIAEPPGDPRFGMDVAFSPDDAQRLTWNDLSWENTDTPVGGFLQIANRPSAKGWTNPTANAADAVIDPNRPAEKWGRSAADMAGILLQAPMLVAIHATELIEV